MEVLLYNNTSTSPLSDLSAFGPPIDRTLALRISRELHLQLLQCLTRVGKCVL